MISPLANAEEGSVLLKGSAAARFAVRPGVPLAFFFTGGFSLLAILLLLLFDFSK